MRAALLTDARTMSVVDDFPEPDVADDAVLIRVAACGICGSDIHGYDGSTGRRRPPLVMGHEAAGVVERVGDAVDDLTPGDRVTFDSMVSCGRCGFCADGRRNLCDDRQVLGVSCGDYRRHGALADRIAVPRRIVYRLPDELTMEHAALVEAVSVAVHAANVSDIRLGDTALIVGSGMIGLLCIQAARAAGATRVIATDLSERRLSVARDVGADETFVADERTIDRVRAVTAGRGVDVAMEVVGATPTVRTAIESTRKGGTVTLVGNVAPTIDLPLQSVVTREIRLQGTCGCNGEYPQCIDLMARGVIDVSPLITATITLDETPGWFDRLYAGDDEQMKVVVRPDAAVV